MNAGSEPKWNRPSARLTPTTPLVGLTPKLTIALTIGASLLLSTPQKSQAINPDWPTFQYNAQHTANNPNALITPPLKIAWSATVSEEAWTFASAALGGNTLYVGGVSGKLLALDAETGTEKWSFRSEGSIHLTPAVKGNKVYFGSTDGWLVALDTGTGNPIWSFNTGSNINASPNVYLGSIYFASNNGHVYALDAETGEEIWSHNLGGYILSAPAADVDRIYIGAYDGRFVALDRATGAKVWQADLPDRIRSSPSVVGDKVYIGCQDGFVRAYKTEDGASLWTTDLESPVFDGLAADSTRLYATTLDGKVAALNLNDGTIGWTFLAGAGIHAGVSLAAGNVVVGDEAGILRVLSSRDGTEKGQIELSGRIAAPVAASLGRVYVTTDDGQVHAVSAENLAPVAAADTFTIFSQAPINVASAGSEFFSRVVVDSEGGYTAVWNAANTNFSVTQIKGRRFDRFGRPQAEFKINEANRTSEPDIAGSPDGRFVVTWSNFAQKNALARLYGSDGNPRTGEFVVDAGGQSRAAMDDSGGFVIVWVGGSFSQTIFAQRFASDGSRLGGKIQVTSPGTPIAGSIGIAMAPGGDFVVIWSGRHLGGGLQAIFARSYRADGTPKGAVLRVDTHDLRIHQTNASAALSDDGRGVIFWSVTGSFGNASAMFARRLDSNGVPIGSEILVTNTAFDFDPSSVVMDPDGFSAAWQDRLIDGDGTGIAFRRFDRDGNALGSTFRINSFAPGNQKNPKLARNADGRFVAVWEGNGTGDSSGIFGRRFDPFDNVLANDTDSEGSALTAVQASGPDIGDLALETDGSFAFLPPLGFQGLRTFTYKANDGLNESEAVTVTLEVDPAVDEQAPVFGAEEASPDAHQWLEASAGIPAVQVGFARVVVEDPGWGLSASAGSFSARFSTDAGRSFSAVPGVNVSLQIVSGGSSAQDPHYLTASDLSFADEFSGQNLIEFTVSDRAGNTGVTTFTIKIDLPGPDLTGIVVSPEGPTIDVGETQLFSAIGEFSDGSTQTLSTDGFLVWTSEDELVATIDKAGLASTVGAGNTLITASVGVVKGTTTLIVKLPDSLPPRTTLIVGTPQADGAPEGGIFVARSTLLNLTSIDDNLIVGDELGSAVQTKFSIDNGAFTLFNAPFTLGSEGPRTVRYFSTDLSGNSEAVQIASMTVDATAPESELSLSNGEILRTDQPLIVGTVIDALSGIATGALSINIDGTPIAGDLSHNAASELGDFTAGTPLLRSLLAQGVASTDDTIYLTGGWDGSRVVNTIYHAKVAKNGTIGPWVLDAQRLPNIIAQNAAIANKGRLYAIGWNQDRSVYYADINSDGSLQPFKNGGPYVSSGFSEAVGVAAPQICGNYMYIIGGAPLLSRVRVSRLDAQTGAPGPWRDTTAMPFGTGQMPVVEHGGKLYVLGGKAPFQDSLVRDDVMVGTPDANGDLTWTLGRSMPRRLNGHGAVVHGDLLVVFGGYDGLGGPVTDTVYTTRITASGLEPWVLTDKKLLKKMSLVKGVVINNHLIVSGGLLSNGRQNFTTDIVSIASLGGRSAAPTEAAITATPAIPLTQGIHSLTLSARDRVDNTRADMILFTVDSVPPSITVLSADEKSLLTPQLLWFPSARPSFAASFSDAPPGTGIDTARIRLTIDTVDVIDDAVISGNSMSFTPTVDLDEGPHDLVFTVVDKAGNETTVSIVFAVDTAAPISGGFSPIDGAVLGLGTVTLSAAFTEEISGLSTGTARFLVDGSTILPVGVNFKASADLGEFAFGTPLLEPVYFQGVASFGDTVYVSGGYNGARTLNTVHRAKVADDGTVGPWVLDAQRLPRIVLDNSAIAANGRLYVIGSGNNRSVYYADINGDGSLNPFKTGLAYAPFGTSAEVGIGLPQVCGKYLYIIGGGPLRNRVRMSRLDDKTGAPGTWRDTNSLPFTLGNMPVVEHTGKLYVIGGREPFIASNPHSEVLVGTPDMNGDLTWTADRSLPVGLLGHGAVAHGDLLVVFGGATSRNGGPAVDTVYTTRFTTEGLAPWELSDQKLLTKNVWARGVVVNNHLIVPGGLLTPPGRFDPSNAVIVASLGGGGGLDATFTAEVPGLKEGEHTLITEIEDFAGNVGLTSSTFSIDGTPPTISISSPQAGAIFIATRDLLKIDFSAEDNFDPAPTTTGLLVQLEDRGSPRGERPSSIEVKSGDSIEPFDIDDGIWELQVSAVDFVGNATATAVGPFEIVHDVLPPQTTAKIGTPQAAGEEGVVYISSATAFDFESLDDLAGVGDGIGLGVATQKIFVNGALRSSFQNSTPEAGVAFASQLLLAADDDGAHEIGFWAEDPLANRESTKTISVFVDNTPPVVSFTFSTSPVVRSPANEPWFAENIIITWSATDEGAGVAEVQEPTNVSAEGKGTSYVGTASDRLVNNGAVTAVLNLDKTPPVVTLASTVVVLEGSTLTLAAAVIDNLDPNPALQWRIGSDPAVLGSLEVTRFFPDDASIGSVFEAVDHAGHLTAATSLITVRNVAPSVDAGPDQVADEGSEISITGAFTDPGADTHTATIDWGDGTITNTLTGAHAYADNGIYFVVLTVTDDDGGVGVDVATVTINNVAPTASVGADQTADEGSLVLIDGSFTDPGTADTHVASIDWGDGTTTSGEDGSHAYADNGSYLIALTVTDDDGGVGVDVATVTINNVAPTALVGTDQTADEGSLVSIDGSFTDPGTADTHIASIDWGDGATTTGEDGSHAYADNGIYFVSLTVTDDDGGVGVDVATVTINNVAPTASVGADQTADEGSLVSIDGSFTDPGTADTHVASIDWGDGSTTSGEDGSHAYADNGIYFVALTVTDDDGGVGVDVATVTINNVAPTASVGTDQTADEGSLVSIDGSFTDPGTADTHVASIDWGDGTTTSGEDGSHAYADNGIYFVALTVTDDDGGIGIDVATVTINNVAPTASVGADQTADEGSLVSIDGSFTDPGTADTHIASIDWGDGSTTSGEDGSHAYADNGIYFVALTVTDDDGGVGVDVATVTINNVAPTASVGTDQTADEGSLVSIDGSFTDPGTADTHIASIDWGDGTTTDGEDGSHAYADNGSFIVKLTVTDDDGGVGIDFSTITVLNVAPTVSAGADQSVLEGQQISIAASFFDPGADTHTSVIDWGDNSSSPGTSGEHTYGDNGSYQVTVTVTDDDGGVGSDVLIVTVANVAPTVGGLLDVLSVAGGRVLIGAVVPVNTIEAFVPEDVANPVTVALGHKTPLVFSQGVFSDPGFDVPTAGTSEDFTALIDWGDGSQTPAPLIELFEYPGAAGILTTGTITNTEHTYNESGIYPVTIRVFDDDGGIGMSSYTATADRDAPATLVSYIGPVVAAANAPGALPEGTEVFIASTSRVILTADDPTIGNVTSGVQWVFWRDGETGPFTVYSGPLVLAPGLHLLEFYSVDLRGNIETTQKLRLAVDGQAPETVLAFGGTGFTFAGLDMISSTIPVVLSASDPLLAQTAVGVAGIFYTIDGGAVQTYEDEFTLPDGTHEVEYWATDRVANEERQTITIVVADFLFLRSLTSVEGFSMSGTSDLTGNVRTNGAAVMSGNAEIDGDITAESISVKGKAKLNGNGVEESLNILPEPISLAAVGAAASARDASSTLPASWLINGVLNISAGQAVTLPSGTYVLSGIKISGGASVSVIKPVQLFVTGDIRVNGGGSFNADGDAFDLVVVASAPAGTTFNGGARVAGVFYNPIGLLKIAGNAEVAGRFFYQETTFSGNSNVFETGETLGSGAGVGAGGGGLASLSGLAAGPASETFVFRNAYSFPNPAVGGAAPTIHVSLGIADQVQLKIYDLSGRLVHQETQVGAPPVITDGTGSHYAYEFKWRARIASGIYLYTILAEKGGQVPIRKAGKLAVVR